MLERKGCGCGEGKAIGALYVIAVPFAFLFTPLSVTELKSWGAVFVGLVCATLAGKVFGMRRNRKQTPAVVAAPVAAAVPEGLSLDGVSSFQPTQLAFDALSVGFDFGALPMSGLNTRDTLGTPYEVGRTKLNRR